MPGQIKLMIDSMVRQRANNNPTLVATTITKLIIKGVNPNHFLLSSADDPKVIAKLRVIAQELGVTI
jgi:hypothetical protein